MVRTSRCGRDNPGSTPGEDIFRFGPKVINAKHGKMQIRDQLGVCCAQKKNAMWCCVN